MIPAFNIENFVSKEITHRSESLMNADFKDFDSALKDKINKRCVLVIGGAGTIGSSYIKELLRYNLNELYVFDLNENGLTELVRDLRSSDGLNLPKELITYPIDFTSHIAEKIFVKHGPFDIVANFAAHKHVRSEKDIYSIEAMLENNVIKNRKLLDLLLKYPPEHFFCVSTDKAANPANIMGASKKLLEELLLSFSNDLNVTTARFANVAFSNGSLPLGFLERANKHQPWSCPLNIKRFFVSPKESGEICLFASVMGNSGDIFFPKLDPEKDMVAFSSIAIDLLRYWELEPDICSTEGEARMKALELTENSKRYPIYFFESDTSGEKPYEEFFTEKEELDLISFKNLGRISNPKKQKICEIDQIIESLQTLFMNKEITKKHVIQTLGKYISTFDHIEMGKNLDQRM